MKVPQKQDPYRWKSLIHSHPYLQACLNYMIDLKFNRDITLTMNYIDKRIYQKRKVKTQILTLKSWNLPAEQVNTSNNQEQNTPIFRELTGKYCVTGFFIVRRSFSRLPTADMLSF